MTNDNLLKDLVRAIMRSPLSLDELAAKANVCRGTLDNWIDGKVIGPRILTVAKVARALDLVITFEQERLVFEPRAEAPVVREQGLSRARTRMLLARLQ